MIDNTAAAAGIISIHASRVGGDTQGYYTVEYRNSISIHASRVGGDAIFLRTPRSSCISIHASRVGGDIHSLLYIMGDCVFQSTPPGWEATALGKLGGAHQLFQSTPPGWEATCR